MVKNPPANEGDIRHRFDHWVRKISWNRKWQPTPVVLPGESLGQRSLAGYSPWGHKAWDAAEQLNNNNILKKICIHCKDSQKEFRGFLK